MAVVALVLILLAAAAALDLVALRFHLPHPVLLVIGGLVLALSPGLPRAELAPELVFLIFVPPLLYASAITTSWRDFRANLRSILLLAIGLVLATIAAVAVVGHAILPGLTWPAAIVLGAIVAPPDAVATTAVTRTLGVPRTITALLEGESLVNDATALVVYRMALRAAGTGGYSLSTAVLQFAVAGGGGVAFGLGVGWTIAQLRRRIPHVPEVENTISLLTPFAAFIPADRFGLSGVLAVVAAGLYLGRRAPRLLPPATRVQAGDMWNIVTFLLEGLIFILVGLDLPLVLSTIGHASMTTLIGYALLISATTIVVRFAWTIPGAYLPRLIDRWRGKRPRFPPLRHVLFVAWAGMRGADSLVIALALPMMAAGGPFPGRGLIIFITFGVILVTLVLQGLSLRPVIHVLGLGSDEEELHELAVARALTASAALRRLDALEAEDPALGDAVRLLRDRHRHRLHRYQARARQTRHERDERAAAAYRRARQEMIDAERDEVIRLRDRGRISDDVMRQVQRDLDLEQLLLESPEGEIAD